MLEESQTSAARELRDYFAILRARKWTVITMTLLVAGSSFFFSYRQTPLYTAEARVLVTPMGNQTDSYVPPPNLDTEAEVAASEPVAARVVDEFDVDQSMEQLLDQLSVERVANTEVLIVSFTSPDPDYSANLANGFAEGYISYRKEQQAEDVTEARDAIDARIKSVRRQIKNVEDDLEDARGEDEEASRVALEGQRTGLLARLGVLQQELEDLSPETTIATGGGEVIEEATAPDSPSSPDLVVNSVLGGFLGIALGIALAFVRENLDDRFRGRSDVEDALQVPVLATIPRFSTRGKSAKLVSAADPQGIATEAYRSLRTSLQFIASQRGVKSMLVTSASEGEGKTATTANLGVALAQAGRTAVLVSSDLRRPTLERYFDLDNYSGLSTWLSRQDEDLDALVRYTSVPNLLVLSSGPVPPNPTELLNSPRMIELVTELQQRCDMLIFDSPPILPVSDAGTLAPYVGGVILVLDAASTGRSAAIHAKEALERMGGQVLGCVLNAFDPGTSPYGYGQYYGRYYGQRPSRNENAPDLWGRSRGRHRSR